MYIELHARSAFSFLEGSSLPEELVGMCKHFEMPAMGLLDTDGVYGAPRFHLAANKTQIKAHIGAEVSCTPLHSVILSRAGTSRSEAPAESTDHCTRQSVQGAGIPRSARNDKGEPTFRLPLLIASRPGYQNLCRLITKMKLRAKKGEGAVALEELQEHAEGLICLTGGDEGPLAAALKLGPDEARKTIDHLIGIFGHNNVYVELQRHFRREEESRNRVAIDLARAFDLPLLATNGVNYSVPKARELADAFTAIRHHKTLSTAGRLLARNSERHLKSPAE